jgi:hypothetical protein
LGEYELPPKTQKPDIFHPQLSIPDEKLPRATLQAVLVYVAVQSAIFFIKKTIGPTCQIFFLSISSPLTLMRELVPDFPVGIDKQSILGEVATQLDPASERTRY